MKTLEDEWYIVIKAYKLASCEILGKFLVLPYIACLRYPYVRVYGLYDMNIIESVDSICRDSADTQYMLIQTNFSKSPKQLTYKPL